MRTRTSSSYPWKIQLNTEADLLQSSTSDSAAVQTHFIHLGGVGNCGHRKGQEQNVLLNKSVLKVRHPFRTKGSHYPLQMHTRTDNRAGKPRCLWSCSFEQNWSELSRVRHLTWFACRVPHPLQSRQDRSRGKDRPRKHKKCRTPFRWKYKKLRQSLSFTVTFAVVDLI